MRRPANATRTPAGAPATAGHGAPASPVARARRLLAAGLLGTGALAATLLTATVTPAAPPAPDRPPGTASSDVAQLSRD
ncbi:hypothetical protein [Streptomyces bikiniensis]|uniref:hypothetical protein n=1 Tax=Streptomyces bikiniensis TaxID=1896 RepID=UPI000A3ED886|nr:hypothetical protein [Streptomyces bikiniensis]